VQITTGKDRVVIRESMMTPIATDIPASRSLPLSLLPLQQKAIGI
jgi:hypothetical protein